MTTSLLKNKPLTANFVASKPFAIADNKFVLDWTLVVTTATTQVKWYFEFCGPRKGADDPNAASTTWYREVDEVDAGAGVVGMTEVVRSLNSPATTGLTVGTHNLHMEFERVAAFGRVQIEIVDGGGAVVATVDEELGYTPQTPA